MASARCGSPTPLPADFEIEAVINADGVTTGRLSNAFVIFDYQSPTDFKFAGAYVGSNRWLIGHRTSSLWVENAQYYETINASQDYSLRVAVEGTNHVTLWVNDIAKMSYQFSGDVTDGSVGVGTRDALSRFDNVTVRSTAAAAVAGMATTPAANDPGRSAGDGAHRYHLSLTPPPQSIEPVTGGRCGPKRSTGPAGQTPCEHSTAVRWSSYTTGRGPSPSTICRSGIGRCSNSRCASRRQAKAWRPPLDEKQRNSKTLNVLAGNAVSTIPYPQDKEGLRVSAFPECRSGSPRPTWAISARNASECAENRHNTSTKRKPGSPRRARYRAALPAIALRHRCSGGDQAGSGSQVVPFARIVVEIVKLLLPVAVEDVLDRTDADRPHRPAGDR